MPLASRFSFKGLALGFYLTSRSSFSSCNSHVNRCVLSSSLKSEGGLFRSARAYRSNYLYVNSTSDRSLFPEQRYRDHWILHTEKAVHPKVSYTTCMAPAKSSGAGSNGSNQTPPKLSIVSFLYKLIVGVVGAMYEAPSKLISFLIAETSMVAEIEEDLDKGAETVEKVATIVEQAAILVKEAADVVAQDARKTEDFMEKAQSIIKKLEKVTDDISNADSQSSYDSNSKSDVLFQDKTTSSETILHAQIHTNNMDVNRSMASTAISVAKNTKTTAVATDPKNEKNPVNSSTSKSNSSILKAPSS